MKKAAFFLNTLAFVASSSLFAASQNSNKGNVQMQNQGQNQGQMMNQPGCAQLTVDEQNFANQLNDITNKALFCTQFTLQQRQQAMQMMGQRDASGNIISADQAVQQTTQNNALNPMTQPKARASGGCPVQ